MSAPEADAPIADGAPSPMLTRLLSELPSRLAAIPADPADPVPLSSLETKEAPPHERQRLLPAINSSAPMTATPEIPIKPPPTSPSQLATTTAASLTTSERVALDVPASAVQPLMSVLHEFLVQLGDNAVNGQEAGNGASAGAKRRGIVQTRTKRVLVRSESSAGNGTGDAAGGTGGNATAGASTSTEQKATSSSQSEQQQPPPKLRSQKTAMMGSLLKQAAGTNLPAKPKERSLATGLLAMAKSAKDAEEEEKMEQAGKHDYRLAVPAKLISGSKDIKRMLSDLKREQIKFLSSSDTNADGRLDADELEAAFEKREAFGGSGLNEGICEVNTGAELSTKTGWRKRISKARNFAMPKACGAPADAPAARCSRCSSPMKSGSFTTKDGQPATANSFSFTTGRITPSFTTGRVSPPTRPATPMEGRTVKQTALGTTTFVGPEATSRWMISPLAPWRRGWDIAALLFTVLTVMLLPLQFAFVKEIGNNPIALAASAMSDIFFLCDIVVHFRTGFIDIRGNVDLTPQCAAH